MKSFGEKSVLILDPIYTHDKVQLPCRSVCPYVRSKILSSLLLALYSFLFCSRSKIIWNGSSFLSILPSFLHRSQTLEALVLHSGDISSSSFSKLPIFYQFILKASFKRFSTVISLSSDQLILYQFLCLRTIASLKPSLPIPDSGRDSSKSLVFHPFISSPSNLKVVGSGYALAFYRHDLFVDLSVHFPHCDFHLFLYGSKEEKILEYLVNSSLRTSNLFIHVDVSPELFNSCLAIAGAYVRTSSIDSWGIAVSDAISFGVPVVASDVCQREEGTILFKNGSFYSLCQSFTHAISTTRDHCSSDHPEKSSIDWLAQISTFS